MRGRAPAGIEDVALDDEQRAEAPGQSGRMERVSSYRNLRHAHSRTWSNISEIYMNETSWLVHKPGFWSVYLTFLISLWLVLCIFTDAGMALTWLNLLHALGTFPLLHWISIKGLEKQNVYDNDDDSYTFWEQIDDGKQWTRTRKWLLVIPVVLYLMATNSTDFRRQPLLLNLLAMLVLVIPKIPFMAKNRQG